MAEVAKSVYRRLIEAGLPVEEATVLYKSPDSLEERKEIIEKQNIKNFDDIDWETVNVIVDNKSIDNIRDEVNVPMRIRELWLSIGKHRPGSVTIDLEKRTYDDSNNQIAATYRKKFVKLMKELGFEES